MNKIQVSSINQHIKKLWLMEKKKKNRKYRNYNIFDKRKHGKSRAKGKHVVFVILCIEIYKDGEKKIKR